MQARLWLLVNIWFQILFHLPFGMLFTFPSRYLFTIDLAWYLVLEVSAPMFKRDFSGPALLVAHLVLQIIFHVQDYYLLWLDFPDHSIRLNAKECWLIRVRSPLLTESLLISFPPATKMFQFAGYAPHILWIQIWAPVKNRKVSLFGNPRIKVCLATPRGLSQPATSFIAHTSQGIHHMLK